MTIEYRENDDRGANPVMTSCPWCGEEFEDYTKDRVRHFTNEHGDEI